MKNAISVLLMLCLPVVSFGQLVKLGSAAGKALVEQTPKVSANISSKLLKARYVMTSQTIQALQQIHAQKVAAVFTNPEIDAVTGQALVAQMQEESSQALASLTSQMDKEYAQWADALLRERNPNFLPKKESSMPGLLAVSPDPKQKKHMTPRFFREWTTTIPEFEELPDEVNGLISALRKRLTFLETETFKQARVYLKAKSSLDPLNNYNVNRFYNKQMLQANRALLQISKESAQCVSDLVYLLNLYPSLFKDSLTLLAYKLDDALQTEFNTYLRKMIDIPAQKKNILRPVGFNTVNSSAQPPLKGKTFTGFH